MTGEALAGMRTVNVDCLFNVPTKYGIIGVGILLKTDASNEKGKVVVGKMVNETPDKGATLFRMASEAPEITVGHESSLCRQVEALYGLGARPEARSQQRHPAIEFLLRVLPFYLVWDEYKVYRDARRELTRTMTEMGVAAGFMIYKLEK